MKKIIGRNGIPCTLSFIATKRGIVIWTEINPIKTNVIYWNLIANFIWKETPAGNFIFPSSISNEWKSRAQDPAGNEQTSRF